MTQPRGDDIAVGVVGVGSMGRNHVRVYDELDGARVVGVTDADGDRARDVAREFDTEALSRESLLERADAVSVAVPTRYHRDVAKDCFDAGVHVLIEKPIAPDVETGRELERRANEAGVTVQVGHIERFNPAVQTLQEVVSELEVLAVSAKRLGPPIEREIDDTVILDLMIHDIDVVLSVLGDEPEGTAATGIESGRYATATLDFDDDTVARLTASRVTQRKQRRLTVTARECVVDVDYIDQTVAVRYDSTPEYIERDGDVRYRHESVVERPVVENGEPLEAELASFLRSVRTDEPPEVTARDGITALEVAREIDDLAFGGGDS